MLSAPSALVTLAYEGSDLFLSNRVDILNSLMSYRSAAVFPYFAAGKLSVVVLTRALNVHAIDLWYW